MFLFCRIFPVDQRVEKDDIHRGHVLQHGRVPGGGELVRAHEKDALQEITDRAHYLDPVQPDLSPAHQKQGDREGDDPPQGREAYAVPCYAFGEDPGKAPQKSREEDKERSEFFCIQNSLSQ